MKRILLTCCISVWIMSGIFAQWVGPVTLGRSFDAYRFLRTSQNQIVAVDSLNLILFIHNQDNNIGGSNSQNLLYDVSVDNGLSFLGQGSLNWPLQNNTWYPEIAIYNPLGNPNWKHARLLYKAESETLFNHARKGIITGVSEIDTNYNSNYKFDHQLSNRSTYEPGGFCKGKFGEYWFCDFDTTYSHSFDSLRLYKGNYVPVSDSMIWSLDTSIYLSTNMSYDGIGHVKGLNMFFSPDGMNGWVSFLGDLNGAADSVYSPVFIHTTDGGQTWGSPVEINLQNFTDLIDTLRKNNDDPLGNPYATGRLSCMDDYDIVVDANGNPHLFVNIASAERTDSVFQPYQFYPELRKYAVDITSFDGGVTWEANLISPILTWNHLYPSSGVNDDSIIVANNNQIARSPDGNYIFYSWVDTDTTVLNNPDDNEAPNLLISACRVSDGKRTCNKKITHGDILWDGKLIAISMSPEVLTYGPEFQLPIVHLEMIANDPSLPCRYHYWGLLATLELQDFVDPHKVNMAWEYQDTLKGIECYSGCVATPSAAFSYNIADSTVTFQNGSSTNATSYYWDFGDGDTSTVSSPIHTFDSIGIYTVCLITENPCGSDTLCISIDLACSAPVANFQTVSNLRDVQFTDLSAPAPTNWYWDFGDATFSTQQNPMHSYTIDGIYETCLTVSDSCGQSSQCQTVNIITLAENVQILNNEIQIFPNPVGETLHIKGGSFKSEVKLSLFTLLGEKVRSQIVLANSLDEVLDVSALAPGIYLIKISAKDFQLTKKIIVH